MIAVAVVLAVAVAPGTLASLDYTRVHLVDEGVVPGTSPVVSNYLFRGNSELV